MLTVFLSFFFWRVLGSAVLERNVKWQLEREAGGSVLSHCDASSRGPLTAARGGGCRHSSAAAAFPQNFAEKGERADLAGYQFWHRIHV